MLVTQAVGAGDLPGRLGALAAEIAGLGMLEVIRPDEAASTLVARGLDPITCGTDGACLADAGRRLGVRYVIAVGVGRFGEMWGLDVRLLDLALGGDPKVASATYADPGPDWTAALREALSRVLPPEMRPAPPRARIAVATREPGATVLLDGAPVGETPLELPVAPGVHRVEVRREGFASSTRELELAPGERLDLDMPLVPLAAERPAGAWPWIAGGAGAVALTAAIVLHATALTAGDEANELSGHARIDRNEDAKSTMVQAGVMYGIAGAAGVITGILLAP